MGGKHQVSGEFFSRIFEAYGDRRSFFVNQAAWVDSPATTEWLIWICQAINLLYVIYGGAILYPRSPCDMEPADASSKNIDLENGQS